VVRLALTPQHQQRQQRHPQALIHLAISQRLQQQPQKQQQQQRRAG
jgi:hypothetical protein